MPTTPPSPTFRSWLLRLELRRLRKQRDRSLDDVAKTVGLSQGALSKMESGDRKFLPRTVRLLCHEYDLEESERDALIDLAKEADQPGLWERWGESVPQWFKKYVGLEAEADWIRVWQTEIVHGLLQTEDYARGLYQAGRVTGQSEEVEKHIQLRMARQERFSSDNPPKFWCILGETALRRQIGGQGTMRGQLEHLVAMASHPSITLQVLPYSGGAHAALNGSFAHLGFETTPPLEVVYVEYNTGSLYLDGLDEVAAYSEIFELQRASALPPAESLALIRGLAEEHR